MGGESHDAVVMHKAGALAWAVLQWWRLMIRHQPSAFVRCKCPDRVMTSISVQDMSKGR